MKWSLSFWLVALVCGPSIPCDLWALAPASAPTLKVLYTFEAEGGASTGLVEVQPGRFFGVADISPGVFSVTSSGNYQYLYAFPTLSSGLAVFGLTPALNGQLYGSALNDGAVTTFSELSRLH
jgi:hypothetical protein